MTMNCGPTDTTGNTMLLPNSVDGLLPMLVQVLYVHTHLSTQSILFFPVHHLPMLNILYFCNTTIVNVTNMSTCYLTGTHYKHHIMDRQTYEYITNITSWTDALRNTLLTSHHGQTDLRPLSYKYVMSKGSMSLYVNNNSYIPRDTQRKICIFTTYVHT